ncbi:MAG: hypothetical protein MHPSP_004699, partial [Paramarteilia canceri]
MVQNYNQNTPTETHNCAQAVSATNGESQQAIILNNPFAARLEQNDSAINLNQTVQLDSSEDYLNDFSLRSRLNSSVDNSH